MENILTHLTLLGGMMLAVFTVLSFVCMVCWFTERVLNFLFGPCVDKACRVVDDNGERVDPYLEKVINHCIKTGSITVGKDEHGNLEIKSVNPKGVNNEK